MVSLKGKTPVSFLQECLIKQSLTPIYEVTSQKVGTHNPEFTIQVKVGKECAEGTGRSKQEAKHNAAENMLIKLNLINESVNKKEKVSVVSNEKENYVGQLKDYCINQHYPEEKYIIADSGGPAHCKTFNIECCVSQLKEYGIAKTIKQGKQLAAQKMLERLKSFEKKERNSDNLEAPLPRIIYQVPEIKLPPEEIEKKYNSLKSSFIPKTEDPLAYFKDYQKAYMGLPQSSQTLSNFLQSNGNNCDDKLSVVTNIAKELEVSLTCINLPGENEGSEYILMTLMVAPPIVELGYDKHDAANSLLNSLLIFCSD